MVYQWQDLFYDGRFSNTVLSEEVPDFVKLADAYGWQAERVVRPEDLEAAMKRLLDADCPALLDMRIERKQKVFPMVAPGAPLDDIIGAVNVGPIDVMLDGYEEEGEE
jgi:acetolactate synthase-1/2/3 large subunit